MSLIESATNVVVGYVLAVATQIVAFPWFVRRRSTTPALCGRAKRCGPDMRIAVETDDLGQVIAASEKDIERAITSGMLAAIGAALASDRTLGA